MNSLIVYYSRTGKNEELAKILQKKLGCEIERIEEYVSRNGVLGFLRSGMQATFKKMSEIKPTKNDPKDYDIIIVVSPIWAGHIPPPVRTYIYKNKEKIGKIAYASVSYSGYGNTRVLKDLEHLASKKVSAHLLLKEKEMASKAHLNAIESFLNNLNKL
ncbi:MAG: hypothetical protein N3F64_00865 [Nitrososphaeria archaeon]|nr:hypothetical protein [Nitrososphaeria archaeon]